MRYTAANVSAAFSFAGLAWIVSEFVRPQFEDDKIFGYFNYVNVGLALIIGYRSIGRNAGNGFAMAITNGLTASILLAFWAIFLQSANEMVRLSMRRFYADPMAAIEDMFRIAGDFGMVLLHPTVGGVLLIGGIAIAFLVEMINAIWR